MSNRPSSLRSFRTWIAFLILPPIAVALAVFILPFIVLIILAVRLQLVLVLIAVRLMWIPKGKYLLVVHSESPVWSPYLKGHLIPETSAHAVLLNWSERKSWSRAQLSTQVFDAIVGSREHTPSVVLFDPWWKPKVYRFWKPFKAYKRGDTKLVQNLADQLNNDLDALVTRVNKSHLK